MRTRTVGKCVVCGNERELPCRRACVSCYGVWYRAGRPEGVLPAVRPVAGQVGECAGCGNERVLPCHGWCRSCYGAWYRAGKPESGPPPLRRVLDREGRMEDLVWLLQAGVTDTGVLAERIGVSVRTVRAYRQELRNER